MFEETNQTPLKLSIQFFAEDGEGDTGDEFDDLFSEGTDTTDTTGEAGTESEKTPPEDKEDGAETEGQPEETNPEAGKGTAPATVKVKHLGQEVELSMEQLIANAQKGLDYDHIRQERDSLRQAPEIALLDRLARDAGMSRADYVDAVNRRQVEQQIANEVKRGVPEEAARRLHALEEAERRRTEEETARAAQKARNQDLLEFVQEYPDVKEFPPEVLEAISKGQKPLAAYQAYENKQLKAKLAALQKNQDNKQKTAGSMRGAGTPEEADAFSSGFDSIS